MPDVDTKIALAAASLGNPLENQSVLDYLFSFVQMLIVAAVPFLVIAFMVAGLYFIVARGKSDGLNNARSFFFKLLIYAGVILGAGLLLKMFLNLLMDLYRSL